MYEMNMSYGVLYHEICIIKQEKKEDNEAQQKEYNYASKIEMKLLTSQFYL